MSAMDVRGVLGSRPPDNGLRYEEQCARCGSSAIWTDCEYCCGEGFTDHDCGEDCCVCQHPENNVRCDICRGDGGWLMCASDKEWCDAHPLDGRAHIGRGTFEFFRIDDPEDTVTR
jgi:hypothetical protein